MIKVARGRGTTKYGTANGERPRTNVTTRKVHNARGRANRRGGGKRGYKKGVAYFPRAQKTDKRWPTDTGGSTKHLKNN